MPVVWKLFYILGDLGDETSRLRLRLHFEALRQDEYVQSVENIEDPDRHNVEVLSVTFKDGHTQPQQPSYRYLNLLQADRPVMHMSGTRTETFEALTEIPRWLREGRWLYTRDNALYEVVGALPGIEPNIVIMVREWRQEKIISLHLPEALGLFSPAPSPTDPLPWHRLVMAEDEY